MDPATLILLLSLLAGAGATAYVAAAPHDRTLRTSRGITHAASTGWGASKIVAGSVFSKPPARPAKGSSLGRDVGWLWRQVRGGLSVAGTFFAALPQGYRAGSRNAQSRRNWLRDHPESRPTWRDGATDGWRSIHSTTPGGRLDTLLGAIRTQALGAADWLRQHASTNQGDATRAADPPQVDDVVDPTTAPPTSSPAAPGQNGARMTTTPTTVVPTLGVVQEFSSPGSMEEPLADIAALIEQIATMQAQLVEGVHDFINGYAEAKFATGGLTLTVSSMVEAIQDDGQINLQTLAETLGPVGEAIEEAKTLGEHGSTIEATGDVESFEEG